MMASDLIDTVLDRTIESRLATSLPEKSNKLRNLNMHLKNKLIQLTATLCVLLAAETISAEAPAAAWELQRDKDGIKVYTQKVPGSSHQAVRAEMMIDASLNSVVGLIRDTSSCSEWAELCKEAREHKVVSELELYVYSYNDIPWPVKDRDALTHVHWARNAKTGAVTMNAKATQGILPENSNAVRIIEAVTNWTLTPQANGKLAIVSYAHINPNGPTPAWVTNLLLVDTPFKTLQGMRRVVATGRYDDAQFDFLKPL
jgi:hypothetical protein